MKTYWAYGVAGALVLTLVWVTYARVAQAPVPEGQMCATDVQVCADGSYVARTGPNCEFATCPVATTTGSTSTPKPSTGVAIGDSIKINGTTITVLNLVSDSRCPTDVQCIWAGTVSVRVAIDALSRDFTFTLGESQKVGDVTITFTDVTPGQKNSKQTIAEKDYRFIFTVVPATTPATSGVRGTVLIGPTCPVMQDPPTENCADKPYATSISVYRTGSTVPYLIGSSDASGVFSFDLPVGSYKLSAGPTTALPRCADISITVAKGAYSVADISCDSGIR